MKNNESIGIALAIIVMVVQNNALSAPGSFTDYVSIEDDTADFVYFSLSDSDTGLWAIVNDIADGELSIYDDQTGNTPFILEHGAPNASIYMSSTGPVGIGTNVPGGFYGLNLTVAANGTDQAGISLPTSETEWIMSAYDGGFGIGAVNIGGAALSIRSISGNVGLGTNAPNVALDILGSSAGLTTANTTQLKVRNDSATPGTRILFNLVNNGGIRFDMLDQSTGNNWVFQNQFGTFDITLAGTGTREFRFNPNGNLEISGTYLQSSSRSVKHSINPADSSEILDKLADLPLSTWSYNHEEGVTHIGPMSEDFYEIFGVGSTDKGITTVDASGVALAAIQGLKAESDAEIARLKEAIHQQEDVLRQQQERVVQLEMMLAEVLSQRSEQPQVSLLD